MSAPNPQQQSVIDHLSGPMLVIAGPGSGKSFSLVERIANLIINHNVKPEELFAATFTDKAANELVSRISRRLLEAGVAANIDEMYIGTFHSLCLRILEEYRDYTRLKKNFRIMDQFDQTYFFFHNLNKFEELASLDTVFGEGLRTRWQKADLLCRCMNQLSEEMIGPEQLINDGDKSTLTLGKWRKLYLELLTEENLLDFSLIQLETLELLTKQPDKVLAPLRDKFQHILVDEYQDTNSVQEKLLFTLLNDKKNICVVGDDDQGLYRFRGATIRNILEFPDKFPKGECAVYTLTTNYRSDPGIIEFYNNWMDDPSFSWSDGGKKYRYDKKIVPPPGKKGIAAPVIRVSGQAGSHNWHEQVLSFLKYLKQTHLSDWNQAAFLFQSVRGDKPKALAKYLEDNGIPVHAPRSDMFFERNEIRLMLGAYLFLFPCFDKIRKEWKSKWTVSDSMREIWDYYDSCLRLFASQFQNNRDLFEWARRTAAEINGMTKPLDYGWASLFYQLLQFDPFASMVNAPKPDKDERPARNLAIFSQLLIKFEYLHHIQVLSPDYLDKNVNDFFNHYFRYVWQGGIDEYEDPGDYAPKGAVSFMTIHQAKGLEFPIAFTGSLQNGPRKQSDAIGELLKARKLGRPSYEPEELIKGFDFKRLFYTAFSRAQNLLVLTCQEELTSKGKLKVPSKYFREFYKLLPEFDANNPALNLSDLKLDIIKTGVAKNNYSYTSHILVYEGCPRQYQFFKHWEFTPVRQASMIFGVLVHETIEDIHKQALAGTPEAITPDNIKVWFDRNYRNISKRERVYLRPISLENAYKQILRYMERKKGDWRDIRGTEVDVSLVQNDYILKGRIDLIQGK